MPSIPQIINMRRKRRAKYHDHFYRRAGINLVAMASLLFAIILFSAISIYVLAVQNLPSVEQLSILLNHPDGLLLQPTRFYDRSGEHIIYEIHNPAIEERKYISINSASNASDASIEISSHVLNATMAVADPTFWDNPGYAIEGVLENKQSTIAQRLVSDLLLWNEPPSIWRAMRERILAAQITELFGREKILEWYFNNIDYGNLAFGVESAAQVYFGKSAADLNLAESAILAGTAESPALNPHDAPQIARDRGKIVITSMLGQGLITEKQASDADSLEITFEEPVKKDDNLAAYFIQQTWEELASKIPIQRLERGGFKIITSLDYDLQLQAACTIEIHLARLAGAETPIKAADGSPCNAALLLPTLTLDEGQNLDNIDANVIIFDPILGQVLALVGTPDKNLTFEFDAHQPGSLLTPYIYLTAFTRSYNPASLVWDIPLEIPNVPFEITNPNKDYQGPIRLRNALANDYLIPAFQVANQIGVANIFQIMEQSGLDSFRLDQAFPYSVECPGCQLLFGNNKVTLLDMVQSFGIFTNQGVLVGQNSSDGENGIYQTIKPITILEVQDLSNRSQLHETAIHTQPVISAELAYLMTDILSDEAARWPSLSHPNPLEIGRPAGAKIGQTLDNRNAWTVGFTPQLVTGVWMGVTEPTSGDKISPKTSASLWNAIIQYATRDYPASEWQQPPGVTIIEICDPSGMLPTIQCPTIVKEVFLNGQEPTQPDSLYQAYQINRETNRLATVFTPPELIEEKIFLNVPDEAKTWAQTVGLETPPETFDAIYSPEILADAQITSPKMFDHLRSEVQISGRASGEDFSSYRLQAGQGLNPSGWIIIHGDESSAVENGTLATWDTSELNGLYALQLIVLREEQRVDTATIQVTIDNILPEVSIIHPENEQVFSSQVDKTITFQVEASDNLGLKAVEFYINNQYIATQTQPPFAYPWKTSAGNFELVVKTIDLAGNTSQVTVNFSVE